jgi:hypothetical protein
MLYQRLAPRGRTVPNIPATVRSFVLRFWQEEASAKPGSDKPGSEASRTQAKWRIRLEEIPTDSPPHYFTDLESLLKFMQISMQKDPNDKQSGRG